MFAVYVVVVDVTVVVVVVVVVYICVVYVVIVGVTADVVEYVHCVGGDVAIYVVVMLFPFLACCRCC